MTDALRDNEVKRIAGWVSDYGTHSMVLLDPGSGAPAGGSPRGPGKFPGENFREIPAPPGRAPRAPGAPRAPPGGPEIGPKIGPKMGPKTGPFWD